MYNPRYGLYLMKRIMLALLPWMAMTSVARAQSPVDVVFTHMGTINERCVRVDDECFVPFTFLDYVGWDYTMRPDGAEIRGDGGRTRITTREIGGRSMIPLRELVQKLGGDTSWNDDSQLVVLSKLTAVRIRKGHFTIESSLDVKPKVTVMDNPTRVVVDIVGAKLDRRADVSLDGTSRIGQYKPDTVRVVLEPRFTPQISQRSFSSGHSFSFDVGAPTTSPEEQQELARPVREDPKVPITQQQKGKIEYDPASNPDMQGSETTPILAGAPAQVGPLIMDTEGARISALTLRINGRLAKSPTFSRLDPKTIEISLPGAIKNVTDFAFVKGATIREVDTRQENGSLIIRMQLARPMGIEYSLSGSGLQIQLLKPDVGNGRLAGKTIVVDAGHGGYDNGTQEPGVREKDLTLSIAKLVSQRLANEGATVIMTRKTDVFIPLNERPAIAKRNGADFFVSIHINSNELDNTASGTITFFHGRDSISQLLGDCIQREVTKISGLGGMGVWSDTRIYRSGFAVLRGATMPAVLVECGFLNTAKDRRRMQTDDFQNGVATGVVKGLKVFLGDEKKN